MWPNCPKFPYYLESFQTVLKVSRLFWKCEMSPLPHLLKVMKVRRRNLQVNPMCKYSAEMQTNEIHVNLPATFLIVLVLRNSSGHNHHPPFHQDQLPKDLPEGCSTSENLADATSYLWCITVTCMSSTQRSSDLFSSTRTLIPFPLLAPLRMSDALDKHGHGGHRQGGHGHGTITIYRLLILIFIQNVIINIFIDINIF